MMVKQNCCFWLSPNFIKKNQVITIAVGDSYIESVSAVRNLGAFFDEHMSMDVFVHKNVLLFKGKLESCTEFVNI